MMISVAVGESIVDFQHHGGVLQLFNSSEVGKLVDRTRWVLAERRRVREVTSASAAGSLSAELGQLASLHKQGVLSDEEFEVS